jgi:uncharacterized protein YdbL (DUF1318 family)
MPPLVFSGASLEGPFELHSPAGKSSVDTKIARKLLTLSSIMDARLAKITEWKDAGLVGETAAGFLEIRAPEPAEEDKKKELHAMVNSENSDRTVLYNELARIYGTADLSAEKIGQLFARNYRNTAAANYWVQNPADNRWVQKKELNQ